MEKSDLGKYQPSCLLAHGLVNKLSIIVGYCDLLKDHAPDDSVCQKQLHAIREVAKEMATELNQHQCAIDAATREVVSKSLQSISVSTQSTT